MDRVPLDCLDAMNPKATRRGELRALPFKSKVATIS